MSKWLWIAPMLAVAGWSQTQTVPVDVGPVGVGPADGAVVVSAGAFVIPSGTQLDVRLDEALSTDKNKPGDSFTATLMDAVTVNGQVVVAAGTRLIGHVLENHPAGILRGRARLVLALDSLQIGGRSYPIELTAATYETHRKHKKLEDPDPNADAFIANREAVAVPAEAVVHFTLGSPVHV
jgi:hypothetical protein